MTRSLKPEEDQPTGAVVFELSHWELIPQLLFPTILCISGTLFYWPNPVGSQRTGNCRCSLYRWASQDIAGWRKTKRGFARISRESLAEILEIYWSHGFFVCVFSRNRYSLYIKLKNKPDRKQWKWCYGRSMVGAIVGLPLTRHGRLGGTAAQALLLCRPSFCVVWVVEAVHGRWENGGSETSVSNLLSLRVT